VKKIKKLTRKLVFAKETLRSLENVDLQHVVGGISDENGAGTTCYPNYCNVDSDPCS
jgi:hypothetical protein